MRFDPTVNLNGQAAEIEKTVVVLGAPRGGTSMVACALEHLRVPMHGESRRIDDYGRYENPVLRDCVAEKLDRDGFARHVEERNTDALWGFKVPGIVALQNIERCASLLRSPCYVVVFRDGLAVNQRRVRHGHDNDLVDRCKEQRTLAEFCRRCEPPLLIVSYERARNAAGRFVHQLCKFLRIRANPGAVRACERDARYRNGLRIGVDLDRTLYGFPEFFRCSIPAWTAAGNRVVCSSGHCREHWPADEHRLRGLGIDPDLIDASLLRSEEEPDVLREKAKIIDSCDVAFDDDADGLQKLTHTPILRMPGRLGADAKGKGA